MSADPADVRRPRHPATRRHPGRAPRLLGAVGAAVLCSVVAGCANGAAARTDEPTPGPTTPSSASPSATALPASVLLLQAVQALRADEAAVLSPEMRIAARTARNAQLSAAKALSAYAAALGNGCSASPAAFRQRLAEFRSTIATYDRLLDGAAVVKARLPADAARVAAAAKAAGVSAPVDFTAVTKQYDAFRVDAATRAHTAGDFETRAANAYARCIAKAARR